MTEPKFDIFYAVPALDPLGDAVLMGWAENPEGGEPAVAVLANFFRGTTAERNALAERVAAAMNAVRPVSTESLKRFKVKALVERMEPQRARLPYTPPQSEPVGLRDYFAARAPETPEWFEHVPAPGRPPKPSFERDNPRPLVELNESIPAEEYARNQAILNEWMRKRAEHENTPLFHGRIAAWEEEFGKWRDADSLARLVQWRFAFADAMLAARGQKGGA